MVWFDKSFFILLIESFKTPLLIVANEISREPTEGGMVTEPLILPRRSWRAGNK